MRIHATASRPGDEPAASTARARGPISPGMGNMQGESKAQPSKFLLLISVILVLAMGLQSQSRPGRRRDADAAKKMDPVLESMRHRGALRQERVPVIIQFTDRRATGETAAEAASFDDEETGKDDRRRIVAESGGNPYGVCEVMPFVAAEVDQESLARLSSDSRVAHVSLDYPVAGSLQDQRPCCGCRSGLGGCEPEQDFRWDGHHDRHYRFRDRRRQSPGSPASRWPPGWTSSPTPTAKGYLADPYGHGTHVAGIAAGTGSFSGGKYKGIAPGAKR